MPKNVEETEESNSDTKEELSFQEAVEVAVAERVKGLKTNNSELISEKKELKEKLAVVTKQIEGLGGEEGVERLQRLLKEAEQDEILRLLADGKGKEAIERVTEAMRASHERQLTTLQERINELTRRNNDLQTEINTKLVESSLDDACRENRVLPQHYVDVRNRLLSRIHVIDGAIKVGSKSASNGGEISLEFGPKGEPKSVSEAVEELRELIPAFFSPSSGGDAPGGAVGRKSEANPWSRESFNLTKQGIIQRGDPAKADRLKREAGVSL